MALNKEAYIRYKIIDECLTNRFFTYPSIEDIIEKCVDKLGKTFSVSAIQKDIKAMKEDELLGFIAPICFSRKYKGYYYSNEEYSINSIPLNSSELDALDAVSDVLNSFAGSRISENYDMAVKKIFASIKEKRLQLENKQKIIESDVHVSHKGFENFELFFHAISNKIPICFIHYSYSKRSYNSIIAHPFILKEFQNKWYLLAYSTEHKELRTFGLDRIFNPIMLKTEFNDINHEIINSYYTNIYGVYPLPGFEKMKIEFRSNPLFSEFLKANPIHESQKIIEIEKYGSVHFELNLIPSQELLNYFIQFSQHVHILEPESIIEIIAKSIKRASKFYKI